MPFQLRLVWLARRRKWGTSFGQGSTEVIQSGLIHGLCGHVIDLIHCSLKYAFTYLLMLCWVLVEACGIGSDQVNQVPCTGSVDSSPMGHPGIPVIRYWSSRQVWITVLWKVSNIQSGSYKAHCLLLKFEIYLRQMWKDQPGYWGSIVGINEKKGESGMTCCKWDGIWSPEDMSDIPFRSVAKQPWALQ